ncbi:MAG: IS630 family transposase, partial [Candidatus Electryonea clarkiae]|nr:IS630 family transposase [Candidatus Electryonea clarkiae]
SIISRQCLNQRIGNKEKLTSEISSWEKEKNQTNSKIDWQFTTKDARIKLRKLYPSIEVR